ncbi:nitroreductase/quinone reductase family protein [Streptosporangium pseudovulgare]|uniref:Cation-binding protein n=1 Tax=Streptosporangium pseudovulgare TaxID=35765 RepID=A0ABQ2R4W9_9ACTN|nr:nitroreductase/quinone reductase family protein [Streptosporangium pseudovulgare]GGQ12529.1 cation-binding protein [Streptosporangium pseudovulgare]
MADDFNQRVIDEFRANGGRVGGMFEGAPLVLLTTVGARTGRPRTTPVMYARDGERILVFGSNAGSDSHPAWYGNLLRNPRVTVEIGDGEKVESRTATATVLRDAERDEAYARQARLVPAFAGYQAATSRVIPVVALYRADDPRSRAIGDELVRIHAGIRERLAATRAKVDEALTGSGDVSGATGTDRGTTAEPGTGTGRGTGTGPAAGPGIGFTADLGAGIGAELREHCLTLCSALHEHHTREDGTGFPLLERRFPGLRPALERLRSEHVHLADLIRQVEELFSGSPTADPERIGKELDRLTAEIEAHFAYEEEHLVGALNALDAEQPPR